MELTPLQVDTTRLHQLANAIMCQDEEDLQRTLSWPGPDQGSRQQLLNSLQVSISIAVTRQLAAAHTHTCHLHVCYHAVHAACSGAVDIRPGQVLMVTHSALQASRFLPSAQHYSHVEPCKSVQDPGDAYLSRRKVLLPKIFMLLGGENPCSMLT